MSFSETAKLVKNWFINEHAPHYANTFDIGYFGHKYGLYSMENIINENMVRVFFDDKHFIDFRYSWNEPKLYVESPLFGTMRILAKDDAVIAVIQAVSQHRRAMADLLILYEM